MITDAFKMILSDFHNDTVWSAHWVWVTFIMKLYALPMILYTVIMTSVSSQWHTATFTLMFCYLWDLCALHSDCVTLTNTLCDPHNYISCPHNDFVCSHNEIVYLHSVTLYDLPNDCVTYNDECTLKMTHYDFHNNSVIVTVTLCVLTMLCVLSQWLCDYTMTICDSYNDYVSFTVILSYPHNDFVALT